MNDITTANSNLPAASSRQPVDPVVLNQMVADELARATAAQENFTAYTITTNLRRANPTLEIVHRPGVREAVHTQMYDLIQAGLAYSYHMARFGAKEALEYYPVVTVATPASDAVAALPAPINWEA